MSSTHASSNPESVSTGACKNKSRENVAVDLSSEIIDMFRFSEEYQRQKKEQVSKDYTLQVETVAPRCGEKDLEIQELEKELDEKGNQFKDYHVWPVISLKF